MYEMTHGIESEKNQLYMKKIYKFIVLKFKLKVK